MYRPIKDNLIGALTTRINYPPLIESSFDLWIKRWKKLEHELQIYLGTNKRLLDPIFVICQSYIPNIIVSNELGSGILLRLYKNPTFSDPKFLIHYDFESTTSIYQNIPLKNSKTTSKFGFKLIFRKK